MLCLLIQKLLQIQYSLFAGSTCTSSAKIRMRKASAMAAMARLNRTWRSNITSFASKFKLYKSLVIYIFLYCCESWTLFTHADSKNSGFRDQNFSTSTCHKIDDWVQTGGPRGASSGKFQETETRMVRAFHATTASGRPPFKIPEHLTNGLPPKRLEEKNLCRLMSPRRSNRSKD